MILGEKRSKQESSGKEIMKESSASEPFRVFQVLFFFQSDISLLGSIKTVFL